MVSDSLSIRSKVANSISATIAVPDPVTSLNVTSQGPSLNHSSYSANVTINWTIPCKSNGEIEWFLLDFNGKRDEHEEIDFERTVKPDFSDPRGRMSYTETDLQPEYKYTVKVAVKTRDVDTTSSAVQKEWQSPPGCEYWQRDC